MKFKYNFDRKFRMKIMDDWWECYLLTSEECTELDEDYEDGFRALTYTDTRCVFVNEEYVKKDIITHELFHVMVSYFNLGSAGIDVDGFEEIVAEFLEKDLDKFIKIRNKLYAKFKKL